MKCLTDLGGYGVGNQAVKEGRGGQAERPIQRTRPLALGPLGLAPGQCCGVVHALHAEAEATGEAGVSDLVGFA